MHTFRIIQEAFANVKKHSHATRVELTLTDDQKRIFLKIADNGRGIQQTKERDPLQGFGIQSMKLRCEDLNASFIVQQAPTRGIEIRIVIPKIQPEETE